MLSVPRRYHKGKHDVAGVKRQLVLTIAAVARIGSFIRRQEAESRFVES